jgi:hypothetical protein
LLLRDCQRRRNLRSTVTHPCPTPPSCATRRVSARLGAVPSGRCPGRPRLFPFLATLARGSVERRPEMWFSE